MVQVIAAIATPVVSGVVVWVMTHHFTKREENREREINARAELRKQESHLTMKLTFAIMKMSYANSMAILRGKPNGEVEDAVEAYKEAEKNYLDFVNKEHAERVVD